MSSKCQNINQIRNPFIRECNLLNPLSDNTIIYTPTITMNNDDTLDLLSLSQITGENENAKKNRIKSKFKKDILPYMMRAYKDAFNKYNQTNDHIMSILYLSNRYKQFAEFNLDEKLDPSLKDLNGAIERSYGEKQQSINISNIDNLQKILNESETKYFEKNKAYKDQLAKLMASFNSQYIPNFRAFYDFQINNLQTQLNQLNEYKAFLTDMISKSNRSNREKYEIEMKKMYTKMMVFLPSSILSQLAFRFDEFESKGFILSGQAQMTSDNFLTNMISNIQNQIEQYKKLKTVVLKGKEEEFRAISESLNEIRRMEENERETFKELQKVRNSSTANEEYEKRLAKQYTNYDNIVQKKLEFYRDFVIPNGEFNLTNIKSGATYIFSNLSDITNDVFNGGAKISKLLDKFREKKSKLYLPSTFPFDKLFQVVKKEIVEQQQPQQQQPQSQLKPFKNIFNYLRKVNEKDGIKDEEINEMRDDDLLKLREFMSEVRKSLENELERLKAQIDEYVSLKLDAESELEILKEDDERSQQRLKNRQGEINSLRSDKSRLESAISDLKRDIKRLRDQLTQKQLLYSISNKNEFSELETSHRRQNDIRLLLNLYKKYADLKGKTINEYIGKSGDLSNYIDSLSNKIPYKEDPQVTKKLMNDTQIDLLPSEVIKSMDDSINATKSAQTAAQAAQTAQTAINKYESLYLSKINSINTLIQLYNNVFSSTNPSTVNLNNVIAAYETERKKINNITSFDDILISYKDIIKEIKKYFEPYKRVFFISTKNKMITKEEDVNKFFDEINTYLENFFTNTSQSFKYNKNKNITLQSYLDTLKEYILNKYKSYQKLYIEVLGTDVTSDSGYSSFLNDIKVIFSTIVLPFENNETEKEVKEKELKEVIDRLNELTRSPEEIKEIMNAKSGYVKRILTILTKFQGIVKNKETVNMEISFYMENLESLLNDSYLHLIQREKTRKKLSKKSEISSPLYERFINDPLYKIIEKIVKLRTFGQKEPQQGDANYNIKIKEYEANKKSDEKKIVEIRRMIAIYLKTRLKDIPQSSNNSKESLRSKQHTLSTIGSLFKGQKVGNMNIPTNINVSSLTAQITNEENLNKMLKYANAYRRGEKINMTGVENLASKYSHLIPQNGGANGGNLTQPVNSATPLPAQPVNSTTPSPPQEVVVNKSAKNESAKNESEKNKSVKSAKSESVKNVPFNIVSEMFMDSIYKIGKERTDFIRAFELYLLKQAQQQFYIASFSDSTGEDKMTNLSTNIRDMIKKNVIDEVENELTKFTSRGASSNKLINIFFINKYLYMEIILIYFIIYLR